MSMLPRPFLLMITRCVGAALIKLDASASRPSTGRAQVLLTTKGDTVGILALRFARGPFLTRLFYRDYQSQHA